MNEPPITDYFAACRVASLGDREILEGIVAPQHDTASPEFVRALAAWDAGDGGGTHYWDEYRGGRWLVLVRERASTEGAVVAARATVRAHAGDHHHGAARRSRDSPSASATSPVAALRAGLSFSIPLAAILLAHESGHYVAARRLKVNASPPYFIPMPADLEPHRHDGRLHPHSLADLRPAHALRHRRRGPARRRHRRDPGAARRHRAERVDAGRRDDRSRTSSCSSTASSSTSATRSSSRRCARPSASRERCSCTRRRSPAGWDCS